MQPVDELMIEIGLAYDRRNPDYSEDLWAKLHLEALLSNLILDGNLDGLYIRDFTDYVRML